MKQRELNKYSFVQVELQPSSNIKNVFYDAKEKIILVIFNNNKEYLYFNIEPRLIENWKNAESVGKFFAEYIKWGKYEPITD